MIKYIKYSLVIAVVVLSAACNKEDLSYFSNKTAVYFDFNNVDSMSYSMGAYDVDEHFVRIPIAISGYDSDRDRKVKIAVIESTTTAEAGKHYILEDFYLLRKGKFNDTLNIKLLDESPELKTEIRRLSLRIVDSEDLKAGFKDKLEFSIIFSGGFIKPAHWNSIKNIFGEYSKVKHEHCVKYILKREFPSVEEYLDNMNLWEFYGYKCSQYFSQNEVIDENGEKILSW